TVMMAPARLSTDEIRTASRGDRARVETDVAMAFAVSWKPFVKSKPTAIRIVTSSKSCSGILDRRRFQHVGDVLALVHRGFEEIVEVFPFDEVARAGAIREELGQRLPGDSITIVLQVVDREPVGSEIPESLQVGDGLFDFLPRLG